MDKLNQFLKPTWGAEKWILEGWHVLTIDEQDAVSVRMEALFSDGLPFKLTHDRVLYIYAFSLLAQLEVLAIQVPLKFESMMPTDEFKQKMRAQLLDEVFHGLVFTRILYELITPYALPPAYNEDIEALCNFIRHEDCPKVAVVLLNLVAEAWIEELFRAYHKADIAPRVFETILEDEHRHVCEADLYREIGLPERDILQSKLATLEEYLLSNILFNYSYMNAMTALLGVNGVDSFLERLNEKHHKQLEKLAVRPGVPWQFWMKTKAAIFPQLHYQEARTEQIPFSEMHKVFMTQWKDPIDPTMVGEFDVNVSKLGLCQDKKAADKLTVVALKSLSLAVSSNPLFRRYLSHHKLYQVENTQIALVVKLPDSDDHLGSILFENCHELSTDSLTRKIIANRKLMNFCYLKRLELEKKYPQFAEQMNEIVREIATGIYPYPMPGHPAISLSNISAAEFSRVKSPLRMNEAVKFTVLTVAKKPVWNEASQTFLPEDRLPVSVSADHRVFDGTVPIVKSVKQAFANTIEDMTHGVKGSKAKPVNSHMVMQMLNEFAHSQPKAAYKLLTVLQTVWPDYMDFGAWIASLNNAKSSSTVSPQS